MFSDGLLPSPASGREGYRPWDVTTDVLVNHGHGDLKPRAAPR
jgi:hypothetical protein